MVSPPRIRARKVIRGGLELSNELMIRTFLPSQKYPNTFPVFPVQASMISHKPATTTWPQIRQRKNGRVFKYPAEPPYLSMEIFSTQAVKILNHT